MPQELDLDPPVPSRGCKIACETTLADGGGDDVDPTRDDVIASADPDLPPESFWLSKDPEYDWFDRNAFVYERKESTKANSNSTNTNPTTTFSSSSQRNSTKPNKTSIIGLPKNQKAAMAESKRKTCKPAAVRLFPKRSGSVGKSVAEPGSPKVSCMGRVRSKRRSKRKEKQQKSSSSGFCSKVMSIFMGSKRCHRKQPRKAAEEKGSMVVEPRRRRSVSSNARDIPVGGETGVQEPPGLGGVTRFASGRRSGNWAEDFNGLVQ